MTAMAPPASPLSAGSLTQLSLSLLAIVGLILAVSWLLRRFKLAVPRGSGTMAVLDAINIGPRERIALVRVGNEQVLVGIAAGAMVALTPLAKPIELNLAAHAPAFAERLREIMKRPGGTP